MVTNDILLIKQTIVQIMQVSKLCILTAINVLFVYLNTSVELKMTIIKPNTFYITSKVLYNLLHISCTYCLLYE